MRVAVYVRISKDVAGEGHGVAAQEADCRAYAVERGWQVVRVFTDNDRSAFKQRPAFDELLASISEFDAVVCWKLARFYRRLADLQKIIEALGETPVYSASGDERLDLTTAQGRFTANILGSVAQYEVEELASRVSDRARHRVASGRVTTSSRPFGWAWKNPEGGGGLKPDEVEGLAVKRMYDWFNDGVNLSEIARRLNSEGVATATGKKWTQSRVSRVLRNPRNAGIVVYKGVRQTGVTSVDGGLVDVNVWRKAEKQWSAPGRKKKGPPVRSWVAAFLECAVCGGKVRGSSNVRNASGGRRERYKTYDCVTAKHVSWPRAGLEGVVERRVLTFLEDVLPVLEAEAREYALEQAALEADPSTMLEVERLQDEKAILVENLQNGSLSAVNYTLAVEALDTRINALEAVLEPSRGIQVGSVLNMADVVGSWDAAEVEKRQKLLEVLQCRVVVYPKRGETIEVYLLGQEV